MSEELKPCPFCGCSDISMYTNGSDLDNYSYIVECDGCGCLLDTGFESEERAAEEWNRRKEPEYREHNGEVNKMMTNHEVACMLADLFDDPCACNYNGIDEWLPFKCELQDACPNPVGVACWEQYLKWRTSLGNSEKN